MNSKSKKNNKKANGFLMFMLEYQRKHKLDLGDAQETAGSIWKVSENVSESSVDKKAIFKGYVC